MGIFSPLDPFSDKTPKKESPEDLISKSMPRQSEIDYEDNEIDYIVKQTPIQKAILLEETASTNDWVKNYLSDQIQRNSDSVSNPLLVLAKRQTGGRGRGNHVWWSPEGGLYFTLLTSWQNLRFTRDQSVELSLKTAKSVAETVSQFLNGKDSPSSNNPRTEIHPPNDVYVNGKKIAGILIESPTPKWILIGIGVNLNTPLQEAPSEIRDRIVSLQSILGCSVNFTEFLIPLIKRLLS